VEEGGKKGKFERGKKRDGINAYKQRVRKNSEEEKKTAKKLSTSPSLPLFQKGRRKRDTLFTRYKS